MMTDMDDQLVPNLDLDAALANMGGDWGLLEMVMDTFLASAEQRLALLWVAHRDGDTEDAQRLVHGLKGAGLTVGAGAFGRLALQTELALRQGDRDQAGVLISEMERQYRMLRERLPDLVRLHADPTPDEAGDGLFPEALGETRGHGIENRR